MELLGNLGVFVITVPVLIVVWLLYTFLNNLVNRITNGPAREIAGSIATILLFVAIGLVLYVTDIQFFMGLVVASGIWFIVYMARKTMDVAMAQANKN